MVDGTLRFPNGRDGENAPEVEKILGNYRLIRVLGRGAMGEVYLAQHRRFAQREYAIKLIRSDVVTDSARQRFEREIEAMGGLVHPNLVYASDAGVDDADRMYLVMEYVRGKDLQKLVDTHGPFRIPQAAEIIRQVCEGVAHAHKQGVVHRDIKPSNVILSDSMNVKVLDLGIASLQGEADSRMTGAGSVMGTTAFMAPELWDSAVRASPASDVYAIGCTAYSLFTGSPPFAGESHRSMVQMMMAHRQKNPAPLHELRTDAPSQLSSVIARALHKDPTRRFQNAAEFAQTISEFSESLSRDTPLFTGIGKIETYRGTTSRVLKEPSASVTTVAMSMVVLLFAALFLFMAYGSSTTTQAWTFVFGQLEIVSNPTWLGLVIDSVRLLIGVPLVFYLLSGFYSSEIRRTFFRADWSSPVVFVRVMFFAVLGGLAIYLANRYWSVDEIPTLISEAGSSQDILSDAATETTSSRWYLGYTLISQALIPALTFAFPVAWFLVQDIPSLRGRYRRVLEQQAESTFPGELRENLHRFGSMLRGHAGRLLAVAAAAILLLQYNYWVGFFAAAGLRRSEWMHRSELISLLIGGFLALMLATIGVYYLLAYEATSRKIATVGSARDEEDLAEIGIGWLLRTAVLRRVSGLFCMSVLLLYGHAAWSHLPQPDTLIVNEHDSNTDNGQNGQGAIVVPEVVDPKLDVTPPPPPTESWIPAACAPANDALLVEIHHPRFSERLYTEVVLDVGTATSATRIPFVLVPQTGLNSPPSFYIMKEKVSAELFASFAAENPELLDPKAVTLREQSELEPTAPVYDVTANEAIEFAKLVCNGKLPTPGQWDFAFGRYFRDEEVVEILSILGPAGESATSGNAELSDTAMVTSIDAADRPWPIPDALLLGQSPWGCLQMNEVGKEYTRFDMVNRRNYDVPRAGAELELRGWSSAQERDFGQLNVASWDKLQQEEGLTEPFLFGRRPPDRPSSEISFRVVLEQEN